MQLNLLIGPYFGVITASWCHLMALLCRPRCAIAAWCHWDRAWDSAGLLKLSAAEAAGQPAEVRTNLSKAIGFAGFFVIPAVTGLVLCGLPIIKGLFVYGAFTVNDAKWPQRHWRLMGAAARICLGENFANGILRHRSTSCGVKNIIDHSGN